MSYRLKRYITYCVITVFVVALPFIQINNGQIFLLSFDKKQFHLLGMVFNMQELYVLPFLVILLFVGVFFATTLMGRLWCGWACPQTIFRVIYRDLIEGAIFGLTNIANRQKSTNLSTFGAKIKKLLSILIISLFTFSASAVLLFYFVPPYDFFNYLANPQDHLILLGFWLSIGTFFTLDIVWLKENFCIYICPYCRVQSVLYDDDTQTVIYNQKRGGAIYQENGEKFSQALRFRDPQGECIECQKCVKVCPTHIDIRAGMQLECINCLECSDACSKVMAQKNLPSLIEWTSTQAIDTNSKVHYFRPKTIGYMLIIFICIALAIFMGGKRDDILLNITRTSSLYTIHQDGNITNEYILLMENTTQDPQNLILEIQDAKNLKIIRPSKAVYVDGKEKRRVVLILSYQGKMEIKNQDKSIPFKLKLYSKEQPSLSITKESVFIYPHQ
ncbi:cytochrome c oxidase accessory protein CcoG [Helicobacter cholecystus]|nr:cytochrome c oxidase accessory protein CcoG [Helicobacter cholecystus]VEJ24135.1 ferredoxin domain-containing integral membrane protein [Helicobacter cholecystus]